MNASTNAGSFESTTGFFLAPVSLPPVWTVTTPSASNGYVIANPPHNVVLAGANGTKAIGANFGLEVPFSISQEPSDSGGRSFRKLCGQCCCRPGR